MEVSLLFRKEAPLSQCISEYIHLIKSLGLNLDLMDSVELENGLWTLNRIANTTTPKLWLRRAWQYFKGASKVEHDERLAVTFLGLAFCHYHLNELVDYKQVLENLVKLEMTGQETARKAKSLLVGEHVVLNIMLPLLFLFAVDVWLKRYQERKRKLEELQQSVKSYLNNIEMSGLTQ